ncbi:unnamed protein product [Paramecium octaurelia]|uniref:Uncharacterized protein n=1 Tax=Paramecium octaurelia TaxID=43137 RepID=A0A8S1XAH8_PAROT|nr:unnamed protein product [Paramecium octaurelia]
MWFSDKMIIQISLTIGLAYLRQQGTTKQEVLEQLINQSQKIQLPYDQFAGNLIIFKKSNAILKKFRFIQIILRVFDSRLN